MAKKFDSIEERRAYWRQWYANNKHREDYKKKIEQVRNVSERNEETGITILKRN